MPSPRPFAVFAVMLACLLPVAAQAQVQIARPDAPPPPPLRLVVANPAEAPVELSSVRISAEIDGSVAVTSVELTFYNPNRRQLEGELQFPLLDGQSIRGFALDIDGRLREAVPVDKAKGQAVFEDITRQRVDPGLLEMTQGNNFKLRVYPLPPQQTRIVVIRYAESLAQARGRALYRLPLEYGANVRELALRLSVGGEAAPAWVRGPLGPVDFRRADGRHVAELARAGFPGHGVLEIEVPVPTGPQVHVQMIDGRRYFHAELPVAVRRAARTLPKIVGIVWDSSGSGAQRDRNRELALLEGYFRRLRNVEVRLTRLRDALEPVQTFMVADGDWRALRKALESTAYDGATSLGAFRADPRVQEYLLFTDGLGNFGEQRFAGPRVPLHTVSSASRSNPAWLRGVAERHLGQAIDLLAETPQAALERLVGATSRMRDLEATGASDLVAESASPAGGRLLVAGVLTERSGELRVTVEHPGAGSQVVRVPLRADAPESALAGWMWARLRVASLEAEYDLNRAEIRRIGQSFRLVTRETSLIVLDTVEDYARHGIVPPAELMARYEQLRGLAAQRRGAERQTQLERVVAMFREKEAWWGREFPRQARPAQARTKDEITQAAPDGRRLRAEADRSMSDRASAERAMAERAMAEPSRSASPAREEVLRKAAEDRARAGAPAPAAPAARANVLAGQASSAAAKAAPGTGDAPAATIQLKRWTPDAPYIRRFEQASAEDLYRIYLDERPGYLASTAFFLDAADQLFERRQPDLAVRVLSNLAEMDLENRHILRILGYRLLQAGRPALAVPVFRKVLDLSPEEPQSHRDLGLALAAAGEHQKAIDALYEVVTRPWHGRFPEIELMAVAELNAIIARAPAPLDTGRIDPRLLKNLPLDLRVVLTWDADNTDIDLWVIDPDGEKASYSNRLTAQGGRMSPDFTGGYGPEEFSLRKARPGRYRVEANYYGNRQQLVSGAVTLQMKLVTGFGTARERERLVTLRLKDRQEVVLVGEFEVEAAK